MGQIILRHRYWTRIFLHLIEIISFRQKALKALNDRMKLKETHTDSWPELDENQPSPPQSPTAPSQDSILILSMSSLPTTTKDDSNQTFVDAEQSLPTSNTS